MRAAILEDGKVNVKEVPKPSPGHEEALVKITTAGVCHSDLHLAKGDWPVFIPMTENVQFPLGHEGIGIVEELGNGADKFIKKGDRVILGLGAVAGGYWCGTCEYCLSGRPELCNQSKFLIGTFAEYISPWVKSLVKIPDGLSDMEVPLACGGLTAYGAMKKLFKYDVLPGKVIAIIGAAGGLGHYAVQVAKAFGYQVVAVPTGQEKIEFTKKLGADYAVEFGEAEKFIKDKFGGAYASIVFSSKIAGFDLGLKTLKRGGIFVAVGVPAASEGKISLSPMEMFVLDPLIMFSITGTVDDMRELVQLAEAGKIKTYVGMKAGLSKINQVFGALQEGKYLGRAIIDNMAK
jgi:alcohol dehydrogenase, propanol-preferring